MRILLMHHSPLDESLAGRLTASWAKALARAGHDTRVLIADEYPSNEPSSFRVDRVICSIRDPKAQAPFELPRFTAEGRGHQTFAALSDAQLGRYRHEIRLRLDDIVQQFDPHVMHVQHIWIMGQLALETGVPYILSGWNAELDEPARPRISELADQGAENASRILVHDSELLHRVAQRFESSADRVLVMPAAMTLDGDPQAAEALAGIYREVLEERFGQQH